MTSPEGTEQSNGPLSSVRNAWETQRQRQDVQRFVELTQPDRYVGDLLKMEYTTAQVMVHDYHRSVVGGIPFGCLLLATRITPEQLSTEHVDPASLPSILLLRVRGSTSLDQQLGSNENRIEAVKRSNDTHQHFDQSNLTDRLTLNLLEYAALECRILGTFRLYQDPDINRWEIHFGGDIDNFYAGQGLKIYKPSGAALQFIANFRSTEAQQEVTSSIGYLRYSAAIKERNTPESVPIEITAADFIAQKTALFGMTRYGKSNTTKMIASAIFRLRDQSDGARVGQIIFDPNGEYANDNPQDQGCLRNLKFLKPEFQGDVHTYGDQVHPLDVGRHITKLNFFGQPEPIDPGTDHAAIDEALTTLLQGKQHIDDALAEETAGYITAFIGSSIIDPHSANSRGDHVRLRRRLFCYRAILADAGFNPPSWPANIQGLFGKDVRTAMGASDQLAPFMQNLNDNSMSWEVAAVFCRALYEWTKTSGFQTFNAGSAQTSPSGRQWAERHLLDLLRIFDNTRGLAIMQTTRVWHDLNSSADYAKQIVDQVCAGNLVIVDQLLGDEIRNRQAAERIARGILNSQQSYFREPTINAETGEVVQPPAVIIYAEEAHRLLPRNHDDLPGDIWSTLAKEGGKFNIGLVYSTQEPSSIQANILTATENWFIAHLNSTDETTQLRKYNDFADFADNIINVAEPGILKVRTRSRYYTIPVHMDRYVAPPPSNNGQPPQQVNMPL